MDELESLGQRIREARAKAGLSMERLAYPVGVSSTTIKSYEDGKTEPAVSTLRAIASETGCDFLWLIGESGGEAPGATR